MWRMLRCLWRQVCCASLMVTHFFHSQRTCGSETWVHCVTSQMMMPAFLTSWMTRKLQEHAPNEKRKAFHQSLTSWWYWIDPYSMACEVLPQCRCKPAFPNVHPLIWIKTSSNHQNNIMVKSSKGDIIIDHWMETHNGGLAGVKFLHETGEDGSIHYCPLQEKYEWPQHWTWSSIQVY